MEVRALDMDCQETMAVWNRMVYETPGTGYHQYSQWLRAYDHVGIHPQIWGVFDDSGRLCAGVGMLTVRLPLIGWRIAAALHGPVVPIEAEDLWREAWPALVSCWRKARLACVQFQPCEYDDQTRVVDILDALGIEKSQVFRAVKIQPDTLCCEPTAEDEEALLRSFRTTTRQRVRKALAQSTTISYLSTQQDVERVYQCYEQAAKRIGFRTRSREILITPVVQMIPQGYASVAGSFAGDALVGFVIILATKHRRWYYKAGSTEEGRQMLVLYSLLWDVLQNALVHRCPVVDLGERTSEGVEQFKQGFRPVARVIVGSRSLVLNRWIVSLYCFAEQRLLPYRHKFLARYK